MSTTTVEERGLVVIPFAIEIDHPRNDDVLLQSIVNCRLRSSIEGSRPAFDAKTQEMMVPSDQSKGLATFPRTPGMQLHVNPRELSYSIIDPLHNDEVMCARIEKFMKMQGITSSKINGVPPQHGKLDVNRMKTLCREILWIAAEKALRCVKARLPEMSEVEQLPGEFLLNPGAQVQNQQPQFECDWNEWVQRLSRNGG